MASTPPPVEAAPRAARRPKDDRIPCGIIMPISETANHSEQHWQSVQTLLHRGITDAGFMPRNVWESATTDRISERIIGNIFEVPIAVADISDLNPNVMLELGLRLASKKPTVVVANAGGAIPFDIRDFQAIFYPADMNMLGMEDFFRKLAKILKEKHDASKSETYVPFLGGVIVDVTSPQTREVGVNDLLLSRIDDLADRMRSMESAVRRSASSSAVRQSPRRGAASGLLEVKIPQANARSFADDVLEINGIDRVETSIGSGGNLISRIYYSTFESHGEAYNAIEALALKHGGEIDVPF